MFAQDHQLGAKPSSAPLKPNLRGASAPNAAKKPARVVTTGDTRFSGGAVQQNKYTNNANMIQSRESANLIDESINQRDFDDMMVGETSGNLQRFGLGSKFGQLAGTETAKARKRYQSDQP